MKKEMSIKNTYAKFPKVIKRAVVSKPKSMVAPKMKMTRAMKALDSKGAHMVMPKYI
jgi:hypothetical protein